MINGWGFSTRTCGYFSFSEPLQLYFAFLEILLLQPINLFRFLFSEMSSIRAIRRLNCAVKSIIVHQARNFSALPAGKLQDYNFSRLSSYRAVAAFVVPHYMLSADFMTSSLVCAKQMSSPAIELKTDGDVVRFSFDKIAHRNDLSTNENEKKLSKRVNISRKAKLNELRFYRLQAKKKMNSPNPEVRIRYKLEKAKRKEVWLIEKLRKFEVPKAPAETHDPEMLTEEEKHYLKRTGEKKKNYVQVGRRGVFGGVVLNMHLHWKKHETVKLICKPCRPGQIHEYAEELARLSKGIIIDIRPNNTILFYRGKNYVRPEVMSPPDTLSKNKALERYRYMQSLEHTSQFIEKLEKELEEYQDHVARYRKMKEVPAE